MTDNEKTTVSISKELRNKLWNLKEGPEQTYEDVIKELYETYNDTDTRE